MFADIDFSAWSEVIAGWLTFRIAGADFDPLHSAILIAALAAAIVCAIRLWSIGSAKTASGASKGCAAAPHSAGPWRPRCPGIAASAS